MSKSTKNNEQAIFGIVKVNEKGQVIIPVDLRNDLDIKPGDQLVATKNKDGNGVLLLKMQVLNELFLGSRYYKPEK